MSALDRAQNDIVRGELWLARRRLGSFLHSKGHDAEVLNLLGDVCHQMHDDYEAGRMWLTSTAEGEHVDRAIGVFLRQHEHDPNQIAAQLPHFARLTNFDQYPALAQERLKRIGLSGIILHHVVRLPKSGTGVGLGCLIGFVILAVLAIVFLIGAIRTFRWLVGSEPFLL